MGSEMCIRDSKKGCAREPVGRIGDIGPHHDRAFSGQPFDTRLADTGGSAGYVHHPAFEILTFESAHLRSLVASALGAPESIP